MGKVRRGGYIFFTWIGDHGKHVHVFRHGWEVLKWDLELAGPIRGKSTRRLVKLIEALRKEGAFG